MAVTFRGTYTRFIHNYGGYDNTLIFFSATEYDGNTVPYNILSNDIYAFSARADDNGIRVDCVRSGLTYGPMAVGPVDFSGSVSDGMGGWINYPTGVLEVDWGDGVISYNVDDLTPIGTLTGGPVPGLNRSVVEVPAHTYSSTPGSGVKMRQKDRLGVWGDWSEFRFPPVEVLTLVESDSPLFTISFAGSFDVDGILIYPDGTDGMQRKVIDLTDFAETINDTVSYDIVEYLRDNHYTATPPGFPSLPGLAQQDLQKVTVEVEPLDYLGVTFDAGNTLHNALRTGSDAAIYRIPDGIASRTLSATVTNAKPRALWRRGARLFLGAVKTDGAAHIWKSDDAGQNWTQLTMASIWNPAEYRPMVPCALVNGGAAWPAIKKNTREVWIRCSGDEANAGAAPAIYVDTLPDGEPKTVAARQREDLTLIVENGANWAKACNGTPAVTADFYDW